MISKCPLKELPAPSINSTCSPSSTPSGIPCSKETTKGVFPAIVSPETIEPKLIEDQSSSMTTYELLEVMLAVTLSAFSEP